MTKAPMRWEICGNTHRTEWAVLQQGQGADALAAALYNRVPQGPNTLLHRRAMIARVESGEIVEWTAVHGPGLIYQARRIDL